MGAAREGGGEARAGAAGSGWQEELTQDREFRHHLGLHTGVCGASGGRGGGGQEQESRGTLVAAST